MAENRVSFIRHLLLFYRTLPEGALEQKELLSALCGFLGLGLTRQEYRKTTTFSDSVLNFSIFLLARSSGFSVGNLWSIESRKGNLTNIISESSSPIPLNRTNTYICFQIYKSCCVSVYDNDDWSPIFLETMGRGRWGPIVFQQEINNKKPLSSEEGPLDSAIDTREERELERERERVRE